MKVKIFRQFLKNAVTLEEDLNDFLKKVKVHKVEIFPVNPYDMTSKTSMCTPSPSEVLVIIFYREEEQDTHQFFKEVAKDAK